MKKLIGVIVACITLLLLVGCSQNETVSNTSPTQTNPPPPETQATEPPETAPLSLSLNLSLDEFTDLIRSVQTVDKFVTYETSEFTVHREGSGHYGILCFSSPENDEIEIAFFLSYANSSRSSIQTQSAIEAQEMLVSFCEANSIQYIMNEVETNDTLVFIVAAADSSLVDYSLPISIREFRSPDEFLADDSRRETCKQMLHECRYTELYEYITEFIENNDITPNDIVYELQEGAKTLSDLATKCEIITDNIEATAYVYYPGVDDISDKTNVIPFLSTSTYGISLEFKLGFNRNGWLFFDEVTVSNSNTTHKTVDYKNYDVNRDTLGGSLIQEYIYTSTFNESFTSSAPGNEVVIRFKNTDTNEIFDHTLTDDEISAISLLDQIDRLHSSLYSDISHWEDM